MTDPKKDDLDDLFADMRNLAVVPSDALMTRVLSDAATVQPQNVVRDRPRQDIWNRMLEAIGGWPSLGGLAAATVAGIWVGVAPPTSVQDITAFLIGDQESLELIPTEVLLVAGDFVDG
ncbi:MAG: hypothetical protein NWQ23_06915 [Yoonia sp.]|uniref:hypothetical protein n=1 Tax=Yoonia sp. TaxID=2212373 RepID=UPI00273E5585|nr:hypothetical protein [Yoonia sp.]MDP5085134.1 hypothetical protein [Yoonia sp.]